jgi:hypothetical protein
VCAAEGANGQIAVGELAVAARWNAAVVLESCSAVVAARLLAVADVVVAVVSELELAVAAAVVAVASELELAAASQA